MNFQLSIDQTKIVSHETGSLLVTGAVGSGKTIALIERIKKLLTVTERQILVITFSNLAKLQIKNKLQEEWNNDLVFVGSFDSFCQYVLEKHGHLIGYKKNSRILYSDSDRWEIIEKIIQTNPTLYNYQNNITKDRVLKAIKNRISANKNKPEDDLIDTLYSSYRSFINSIDLVDCDGLISDTYKLFVEYPNVAALYRRNFEFVCVEDAQKMNQIQYDLLKILLGKENKNIMLVANMSQRISNEKLSEEILNQFVNDFHPLQVDLGFYYCYSKEIFNYADQIMPIYKNYNDMIVFVENGKCIQRPCYDQYEEAEYVVSEIISIERLQKYNIGNKDCSYNSITILARNNYALSAVRDELEKKNIPYHYQNTQKNVELESMYGIFFKETLKNYLSTNSNLYEKKSQYFVDDTIYTSDLKKNIENQVYQIANEANSYNDILLSYIKRIKETIVSATFVEPEEKILAYSDFTSIEKAWHNFMKRTNERNLMAFLNWMSKKQIESQKETNAVNLNTIQTMTGHDNDIIFLVGMDDGMFPDYRAIQKGNKAIEQEKIKLCSAILRAKTALYVTYPKRRPLSYYKIFDNGYRIFNREKSRFLPD